MEGQTWLLLALSCESLFGAVFAQSCSPLPAADFMENRLESTVRSEGGEGTNPNVILLQHHFTCIAVGSTEGTASSLSIAVRYNVTSTDQPEVQRIAQLLFECSGTNYILSQSDPFEPNQNESLFNLATRRDCRLCAISGSPTIDPDTNCAVCDAMCAVGQGACTETDCCPFYDVVTRMCITTCPAGSINATDFTCNPCFSSPCQNQGECNATSGSNFICICTGSFTGTNCETCSLSCMNGGTPNSECTLCMCPDGYTGSDCSMDIDDCASNPCGANGQCIDGFISFTCNCTSPYTGINCDFCVLQNCARCENAVCVECNRGLIWNGNVDQCVDVCFNNPCQNGGTCTVINDASYMCECPRGRTGINCTMCASSYTMVNSDCVICTDTQCLTCSNGVDTCSGCMDGFQVNDETKQCVAVTDTIRILIGEFIALILGAAFGVLALVLVVIISSILMVALLIVRRKKVKRAEIKDTIGAGNSDMYENIGPVSVKTARFQNVLEASLPPQSGRPNIEMKECLAYGVIGR